MLDDIRLVNCNIIYMYISFFVYKKFFFVKSYERRRKKRNDKKFILTREKKNKKKNRKIKKGFVIIQNQDLLSIPPKKENLWMVVHKIQVIGVIYMDKKKGVDKWVW